MPLSSNRAYAVQSEQDPSVLLAMSPQQAGNLISWFDGLRERTMTVKRVIADNLEHFSFERGEIPATYTLIPLTLETYEKVVRARYPDLPAFADEQSMWAYFADQNQQSSNLG